MIAVTRSCCRLTSIEKPRSSGCVDREVEVGRERRVEVREDVRRDLFVVVELKREVAAAPWQRLHDAGVVGRGVVLDDRAAVELVRGRLHDGALAELRGRRSADTPAQDPRDVQVEGLRVQPLDRELQVALERTRRGLLERQIH